MSGDKAASGGKSAQAGFSPMYGSPESSGRTMLELGLKGVRSIAIWAPGSLYLFLAETRASAKDLKCDMFGGFRIQQDGPSS